MLSTIFGNIHISVNEKHIMYDAVKLSRESRRFRVDARYKIAIHEVDAYKPPIECTCYIFPKPGVEWTTNIETGENLSAISFECQNKKLTIGTLGDQEGIQYIYNDNGITLAVSGYTAVSEIVFYVAWLSMDNIEIEETYTWFATDPSEDKGTADCYKTLSSRPTAHGDGSFVSTITPA